MRRGDVYLVDLNPVKGSEQAGQRPVLIYQNDRLIQVPTSRTVVVIPFTTNLKLQRLPSCLFVPAGEGGLRQDSVLLCHQIRVLDRLGIISCWGTLSIRRMDEVDKVVLSTLGIVI